MCCTYIHADKITTKKLKPSIKKDSNHWQEFGELEALYVAGRDAELIN